MLDRTQLAQEYHADFNSSLEAFDTWYEEMVKRREVAEAIETLKDKQAAVQV